LRSWLVLPVHNSLSRLQKIRGNHPLRDGTDASLATKKSDSLVSSADARISSVDYTDTPTSTSAHSTTRATVGPSSKRRTPKLWAPKFARSNHAHGTLPFPKTNKLYTYRVVIWSEPNLSSLQDRERNNGGRFWIERAYSFPITMFTSGRCLDLRKFCKLTN